MTIFVTQIDRMGQFVDDIVDYANKSFNPQMVIYGEHRAFSHVKITVSDVCYHHQHET
jgi:hypothetical protein